MGLRDHRAQRSRARAVADRLTGREAAAIPSPQLPARSFKAFGHPDFVPSFVPREGWRHCFEPEVGKLARKVPHAGEWDGRPSCRNEGLVESLDDQVSS